MSSRLYLQTMSTIYKRCTNLNKESPQIYLTFLTGSYQHEQNIPLVNFISSTQQNWCSRDSESVHPGQPGMHGSSYLRLFSKLTNEFKMLNCHEFKNPQPLVTRVKVAKLCLTLWTPWTVACQTPSVLGILQARILEWVAFPFSRGSSQPRDRTQVSHIAGRFSTIWATRDAKLLWKVKAKNVSCSVVSDSLQPHGL